MSRWSCAPELCDVVHRTSCTQDNLEHYKPSCIYCTIFDPWQRTKLRFEQHTRRCTISVEWDVQSSILFRCSVWYHFHRFSWYVHWGCNFRNGCVQHSGINGIMNEQKRRKSAYSAVLRLSIISVLRSRNIIPSKKLSWVDSVNCAVCGLVADESQLAPHPRL